MARFRLFASTTSPFVRKVNVVAREVGLGDQLELVLVRPPPGTNDAAVQRDNPLAKIPTLVEEGHPPLYDSPVICEYLDSLHDGPRLIPAGGPERWRVLRAQALSDGVLDAAILAYYEGIQRPPERAWEPWVNMQKGKALAGLDALEREVPAEGAPLDLGQIAVACMLGWMEFRKALGDVRAERPALFAWYEAFRQRPSLRATEPHA
jgi:glutathione S-transferase